MLEIVCVCVWVGLVIKSIIWHLRGHATDFCQFGSTFQDKYILWKSLKQKASIPYQFSLYVFYQKLFFFNKWLSLVWQGDNDTVIHRDTGHGHGVILGLMLTDWMLLSIIVVKQTPTIVETPTQAHITHWPSLSFILTFHRIALNIYLILRWSCDSILYILLELETIFVKVVS